jgi:hypothetical protein
MIRYLHEEEGLPMIKNRAKSSVRIFVWVGVLVLGGCALSAKNVKPAAPYDFARLNHMARYAQAAYGDAVSIRAVCQPAFSDVYIHVIPSTDNKYFLATNSATHVQLIAIAGTANIENVLLDADLNQEFVPGLHISLHRGFARAAQLIYDDVKPHLLPGYHLQITGHSLGGAEAVIVGMILKSVKMPAESIITFGQPKVSNQAGVDAFKDLPLTRVVNQNDLIPESPLDPFRHIGPELVLFPGATYSVVQERPLDPAAVIAAWQALQNHEAPAELPQHYIANYLVNLDSKLTANQDIPYPKS